MDINTPDDGRNAYLTERYRNQPNRSVMTPADRTKALATAGNAFENLGAGDRARYAGTGSAGLSGDEKIRATFDDPLRATRGQGFRGMAKPDGLITTDDRGMVRAMPTRAERDAASARVGQPLMGQGSATAVPYGKTSQAPVGPTDPLEVQRPNAAGQVPIPAVRGGGVMQVDQLPASTPSYTAGAAGEFVSEEERKRREAANAAFNTNAARGASMAPTAMTMQGGGRTIDGMMDGNTPAPAAAPAVIAGQTGAEIDDQKRRQAAVPPGTASL